MNNIIIAIDGYSGCGKTTLSRDLAQATNFLYIDTGAMYRAVALYAVEQGFINENNEIDKEKLVSELTKFNLEFKNNPQLNQRNLLLNGEDVEDKIRTPQISNIVSKVAKIKEIRQKLIAQQRKMSENTNVILDGRDIGSVVFPNANLKLFVTADPKIRAQRRLQELKDKGIDTSVDEVLENLLQRDQNDINRKENPLIKVKDAIIIDTSNFTRQGQLEYVLKLINKIETASNNS